MATVLVLKWNGAYDSTSVVHRIDSSDPSTLDARTLPWTTKWGAISTDNNGTWVMQGQTEGIAYSTDDGVTWTGLEYETEFDFTLSPKPDTGVNDGRPEVTYTPAAVRHSLFYDGTRFVMFGAAYIYGNNNLGVAWTSTDGITWTLHDLPNGGLAYHNNTHTAYGGVIPDYITHDKDRQGRYVFYAGNFLQYPTPHTDYAIGLETDSLGIWNDTAYETALQSFDGHASPTWIYRPFASDQGEGSPGRYGMEYVGGQGYGVDYKKNRFKTDGSNLLMVGEKRYYQRSISSYSIGHWDLTPELNPDSGLMEIPYPELQGGYTFNIEDRWLPQEVVFTGDYWIGAGGMLDLTTGTINSWGYGISVDGGITWSITEDSTYESDIGRCSQPECWDMQYDGRYVWYFGREPGVGSNPVILDPINVWGVYDTQAATPSWQFYGEGSQLGFCESECSYNVLDSFIYTDLDPVISITCEDATTKMGRVLRTNTTLNLGDITNLEYMNIRGSTPISLTGTADVYKFNVISFSTSNIKIAQKNLLLTETEIVKVKGMPLGVGGRFAQLNHYVRNIYNDNPIVYLPLNDRDEDISGTPQNSETDDLQEEVF